MTAFDTFRSECLPANLIQAQRDFSAHTLISALIKKELFTHGLEQIVI